MKKQVSVLRLISAYRIQGVGAAQLDPLKRIPPQNIEALDPKFHGLSDADMALQFNMGEGDFSGQSKLPLSQIISNLKQTYCGHIAVEYIYIQIPKSVVGCAIILKAYCPHRITMPIKNAAF